MMDRVKLERPSDEPSLLHRLSPSTNTNNQSTLTSGLISPVPSDVATGGNDSPDSNKLPTSRGKTIVPGTPAAGGQVLTGGVNPQKIYIGNLPETATLADLEDCFGQFGPCTCAIKRGFGFAEFVRPDHAKAAVAKYHEGHFLGAQITVQLSHERVFMGKNAEHTSSSSSKEASGEPCRSCGKAGHATDACTKKSGAAGGKRSSASDKKRVNQAKPREKDGRRSAQSQPAKGTVVTTLPALRFVMDDVPPIAAPAIRAPSPPRQLGVYERSDRYVPLSPGPAPSVRRARAVEITNEGEVYRDEHRDPYLPLRECSEPRPDPRYDARDYIRDDDYRGAALLPPPPPPPPSRYYRDAADPYYAAPPAAYPPPHPGSVYDRHSEYDYDRPQARLLPHEYASYRPPSRAEPHPPLLSPSHHYAPAAAFHPVAPLPRAYPPRDAYPDKHYGRYDARVASAPPYDVYRAPGLAPGPLPVRDDRYDARAGPVRESSRDPARYQPYGRSGPPPLPAAPSTSARDSPYGAVGTPVPSGHHRSASPGRRPPPLARLGDDRVEYLDTYRTVYDCLPGIWPPGPSHYLPTRRR